jgi:ABC-type nitrate/sulfonate/bicarbonate transport system substrate-binding protein
VNSSRLRQCFVPIGDVFGAFCLFTPLQNALLCIGSCVSAKWECEVLVRINLLCLGAAGIGSVVLAIADRLKLFQKHGVDVRLVPVPGTQIPNLTTTNPMGLIGAPAALMRAAGGTDLKILASFDNALLSGALIVRSEISKPEQLKGKRLGARVVGAALWLHTMLALEKLGLDPIRDGIEIAEIGDRNAIMAALEAGRVAGAVLSKAQCEELAPKGFSVILDLVPLQLFGAPDALVVLGDFGRRSPEDVKRVLAAMIEAVACGASPHKQPGVTDAIKSALAISGDLAVENAVREFRDAIALRPYPSFERLSQMQRMMVTPRPPVGTVKIRDLIDARPMLELDESGFIDRTYSSYGVV